MRHSELQGTLCLVQCCKVQTCNVNSDEQGSSLFTKSLAKWFLYMKKLLGALMTQTIICRWWKAAATDSTPFYMYQHKLITDDVRQIVDLWPAAVKFVCFLYRLITLLLARPAQESESCSQWHSPYLCCLLLCHWDWHQSVPLCQPDVGVY